MERTTKHFTNERMSRAMFIERTIKDTNNVICVNVIDRGHANGAERFELTDKGIIRVYNNSTNRHITDLIARPNQIYDRMGTAFLSVPTEIRKKVVALAREHQSLGYNNI